ncbi:MAG: DUF2786 domain-containing protein [Verrucomicrobia bacterium]|nr:DUF2786 domain-containing protein [Verrucomicrobiota bacterium]
MTRAEAIEKIKKLLRMKRGGTPDEVATALRLAQELAEKHDIELGSLNPDEQAERPIHHADAVHGARVQWECTYAGMICDRFFNVTVFQTVTDDRAKYCMRFVGTDWDTQIAIYVYHFLIGHFRREWKTRRGRCRNRQAFMWGMYLGLSRKLRTRQPLPVQTPGIIAVDRQLARRKLYIQERWKLEQETASPDSDAQKATWKGYVAGQETEINSGVKGNQPKAALIVDASRQLSFA